MQWALAMNIKKNSMLFFGCKIDSKLREALAQAKPGDRRYFEDPESAFLCICALDDERWIGKVMEGGVNVTEVEDIQRNIVSILRRIAPAVRVSASSLKIFTVSREAKELKKVDSETVSPAGEEDEGGPYIVNY